MCPGRHESRNGRFSHLHFLCDLTEAQPGVTHCAQLGAVANDARSPQPFPLTLGARQTGEGPLTQPDAFLLGYRRQNGEHGIAKDAARVEILFSEATPVHSGSGECLKVLQRFQNTLPAESVKRPKENQVEFLPGRAGKHGLKPGPLGRLCAGLVDVFVNDSPAGSLAELAQLGKLVFHVLSFVARRNAGI